jgi:hypothetical protein
MARVDQADFLYDRPHRQQTRVLAVIAAVVPLALVLLVAALA